MGMSLQDQLLKTGLADKKQAKKAKQVKRVKRKKNKGKKVAPKTSQTREKLLQQEEQSRKLNRRINQEKEKQEKLAQIRQLIETNRLDLDKYEQSYYFAVGKKIKKLYVNEDIANKLSNGRLAIVTLDEKFEIVPSDIALKITERDPDALVVRHEPEK